MYTVIFCSLLALLFTFLETKGLLKKGMLWGFTLITFLQIIHYNYGNDYMAYYNMYREVIQYKFNWNTIINGVMYREPGWVILNYLFKPLGDYGFFALVGLISTFQGVVIYKLIRRYVPYSQWTFATLIYLFSTPFYLMSFSMLRQSLVMTIFLSLWPLIEKRKVIIPLLVLYLSSYIHSSAIILLPFAFWGFISMGKYGSRIFTFIYLTLFLALLIYKDLLNDIFTYVMALSEDMETYQQNYEGGNRITSIGLGFLLNLIPLGVALVYISNPTNSKSLRLLTALSSISFIILPFGQIIQLISRIGFYFSIFSILTIPTTYDQIRNNALRWGLISLQTLLLGYSYWELFQSPIWYQSYGGSFHTIFSVIL